MAKRNVGIIIFVVCLLLGAGAWYSILGRWQKVETNLTKRGVTYIAAAYFYLPRWQWWLNWRLPKLSLSVNGNRIKIDTENDTLVAQRTLILK